jgi:hypothetical protein
VKEWLISLDAGSENESHASCSSPPVALKRPASICSPGDRGERRQHRGERRQQCG